jgi:ESAT-6 family protein
MRTATVSVGQLTVGGPARRAPQTTGGDPAVSTTQAQAAVMDRTAAQFDQASDALATILNNLMRELDGLLAAGWRGRGAQAFQQARMAWAEDQTRMQRALAATAGSLREAGRVYTATDESAQDRFRFAI